MKILWSKRSQEWVELTLSFNVCDILVRLLLHDAQLLTADEKSSSNHQGPVKHGDSSGDTSKCCGVSQLCINVDCSYRQLHWQGEFCSKCIIMTEYCISLNCLFLFFYLDRFSWVITLMKDLMSLSLRISSRNFRNVCPNWVKRLQREM